LDQKAAAMTAFEEVNVYGYNKAPPMMEMKMMLNRRPNICEE